jgi:hypothetical protein
MNMKLIKLPDVDTIKARLNEFLPEDDNYMRSKWWPHLLKLADRELYDVGVNVAVEMALYDFLRDYPVSMHAVMRLRKDNYFRALLPDEADYRAVEAIFRQVEKAG